MSYSRKIRRAAARKAGKQALKNPGAASIAVENVADPAMPLAGAAGCPGCLSSSLPPSSPVIRTGPTGPRSPEGKAKSSLNNLRHGLTGQFRVLDYESQPEFDVLLAALREEHQPATTTEAILVQRLAEHVWLSRRAQNLQDGAIIADSLPNLGLFLRYQTTHDRAFHKCLAELSAMRRERRRAAPSAAGDFESQNPEHARQQPRVRLAEPQLSPATASRTAAA